MWNHVPQRLAYHDITSVINPALKQENHKAEAIQGHFVLFGFGF